MNYEFKIESDKVNISDPCYEADTWCGKYGLLARNGNWSAEVEYEDNRVKSFTVVHEEIGNIRSVNMPGFELGVDSGQLGFFDAEIYANTKYDEPGFYRDCCDATLTREKCGVIQERGFVSSSGWGDGGYIGIASVDDEGRIVEFFVEFIPDEEDEEDDY